MSVIVNVEKYQSVTMKAGVKFVRIRYQLEYLKSAKEQKFLPRGIAEQMKYVSPIHDANLQNSLQNLMYFAGSRMLDLLIIYYTSWSCNLRTTYYSCLANLEEWMDQTEFKSFKHRLNIALAKEKEKSLKTSESKLKRDADIIQCRYTENDSCVLPNKSVMSQKRFKSRRKRKKKQLHCSRKRRRTEVKGIVPAISNIPEEQLKNCVINLSSKIEEVSPHQLYLFYLGKKFAPTPPLPDYSQFRLDILQFAYKLRWAWYWFCNPPKVVKDMSVQDIAIKEMEKKLIKADETKPMKVSNNHCLELFIQRTTKDLLQTNNSIRSKLPDNLPMESRKALEDMEKWKDIVIRPADKGSRYFFLDREDYVKRVREHIHDEETFQKVDKAQAEEETKLAIINWCSKYKNEIGLTDKIYQFVTPDDFCKPGNNYVNPKAHKPEKNYPGRMISTGCASAIKNLSALTAHELTKVELDYAIQDTNHILRKIDEINELGALSGVTSVIHASFDIEAMFPNISKEIGLQQCRAHLDKRKDPIFSTDCIIDALEITLDNNITEFEKETFRQIKGTAMGPKNACAYADTAIDRLDHEVLDGSWELPPILWARFRDDVYVPWTFGQQNLERFHDWLNTRIPGIKFTLNSSEHGTEFLDLFIYVKNGKLHSKQYSKPCDDHAFLVPSSCHPSHTIRNIPYSTALRIYKHTSEPAEYDKAKSEYTNYLKARGYCIEIIMEAFRKVESKPRREYYQKQPEKNSERRVTVYCHSSCC